MPLPGKNKNQKDSSDKGVSTEGARILIVDDVATNLKILAVILEREGFEVVLADSGDKAVAIARNETVDLILLDVLMPGDSGFEACRRLKSQPSTAEIPVIFVTAKDACQDTVEGFRVGGVDYITKPFQAEIILARVHVHLRLSRMHLQLAEQNAELKERTRELQDALSQIKKLSGLIPICAACKKIRDDDGYWHKLEVYISDHSDAMFSHSLCPLCLPDYLPDSMKKDALDDGKEPGS